MKKPQNIFIVLMFLCYFLISTDSIACTSAIISGRVTSDGRPILWKNRDTDAAQNLIKYFYGGKYTFIGVCQTNNDNPKSVWVGTNEKGFAIMNTMSYNILKDENEETGNNGLMMKQALENCASVDEFEQMLLALPKPWLVSTNYGVIDAQGNAAYFEVNNDEYYKYDVNDTKVAPLGYIVRTNFSFAGNTETGKGYVRYLQADNVVKQAIMQNEMTPQFIFNNLARSFANPLMGIDLKSGNFNKPKTTGWFVEQDFITRKYSTCSVVVQGVKEGEPALFTTMWTIIGYPGTTPAIPVWVYGGEEGLSSLLTKNENGLSTIANKGYILKESVYSYTIEKSNSEKYFNWEMLFNLEGTGHMQIVESIERQVLEKYQRALEKWRSQGNINIRELKKINQECGDYIIKRYSDEFNL